MVDTFITYGNYENRAQARTRFMQETLGTEGYIEAYPSSGESRTSTSSIGKMASYSLRKNCGWGLPPTG